MPRLTRLCPEGIPQHIIQRGNNRQICFYSEDDLAAYAAWVIKYSQQFKVDIHAWVFMTNHVHLLATPNSDNGISKMMQSIGRMYVRYFNNKHSRSGTLWEGRFKSCLIESEHYLLKCYRYIELNPVTAGMVADPADYEWSSYQTNALGKQSNIITPHAQYQAFGDTIDDRCSAYRVLFSHHLDKKMIEDIKDSVNKGMALGSKRFKADIEQAYQRRVQPGVAGRPRKP
ncbi:MAG: transposase [Moraxellaceae bacterium]|nr:MAG: transposase [Moraxellaceae bacterium]